MKAKWTTSLMIAAFSAALAVGTGASAGEMGSGMKGHENSGGAAGSGGDIYASEGDFQELDKNEDGLISEQEAAANSRLLDRFQRLDSDNDGNLEKGEFAQFEKTRTQYEQEMEQGQKQGQEQRKVPERW